MMGRRVVVGLFAAMMTTMAATACSRTGEEAGEVVPANAVGLTVRNNNYLDMDIYTVVNGVATRVGTVSGSTTRSFVLDPSVALQSGIRLIASPIGGNGRASSGSLVVAPGQTIEFDIGPILSNSSAFIR
ncbi:MAG TPA: hypothetical protein VN600_14320 [Gemmatimonadaceae bacterium]|nr:hypothetical protein [Gemmatimonadaceae bacterium]